MTTLHLLGVNWVGFTEQNGHKLLLSVGLPPAMAIGRTLAHGACRVVLRGGTPRAVQARFWAYQTVNLGLAVLIVLVPMSIWFDDPAQLATAFGLVGAGLAFVLQRVITALAGYVIILRGNNFTVGDFTVGDRISMGGVRGGVLALGFIQTTLMRMGVSPGCPRAFCRPGCCRASSAARLVICFHGGASSRCQQVSMETGIIQPRHPGRRRRCRSARPCAGPAQSPAGG